MAIPTVAVLDKDTPNKLMVDALVTPQTLYEVSVSPTQMATLNKIRFAFTLSRVITPVTCIDASEQIEGLQRICNFTCPLGQYSQATFNGGSNAGGPVIRVLSTGTGVSSFTGYGAIYVPSQGGLCLARWNNQSLKDLPAIGTNGTILDAVPLTLVIGDIVKIKASETTLYLYEVFVNGSLVMSKVDNPGLNPTNPCVGLIDIARVTRDITVFFPQAPGSGDGGLDNSNSDDGSFGDLGGPSDDSNDSDTDGGDSGSDSNDGSGGDGGDGGGE